MSNEYHWNYLSITNYMRKKDGKSWRSFYLELLRKFLVKNRFLAEPGEGTADRGKMRWDTHDSQAVMITRARGAEAWGLLLSVGVFLMCACFDPCCVAMAQDVLEWKKLLTVSCSQEQVVLQKKHMVRGLVAKEYHFPKVNSLSNMASELKQKQGGCTERPFQCAGEKQNAA